LLRVFNPLYLAAQNLVVPAALLVTYRVDRAVYLRLRRTLITAWLMAIPIYALFPTAPPRLAQLGIADTVSAGTGLAADIRPSSVSKAPGGGRCRPAASASGAGRARCRPASSDGAGES
jgi:hypothetical protein